MRPELQEMLDTVFRLTQESFDRKTAKEIMDDPNFCDMSGASDDPRYQSNDR